MPVWYDLFRHTLSRSDAMLTLQFMIALVRLRVAARKRLRVIPSRLLRSIMRGDPFALNGGRLWIDCQRASAPAVCLGENHEHE